MVLMEELSSTYGWTPKEIREQPVRDVMTYWAILNEKRKIQREKIKRK